MQNSRNLKIIYQVVIFGNDHKHLCLLEDRNFLLLFQRTKTSLTMNSGSQSPKGMLTTNFSKTTHFDFF